MSSPQERPEGGKTRWIYGLNPVMEALRSGRAVKTVYVYSGRQKHARELKEEAAGRGISIRVMHSASFFDDRFPKGHQGVAAQVERREGPSLDEVLEIPASRSEPPFFVILDGIEDPRNLGAVLRCAEAAGVHAVITQERRAAGLGPEAVKASAGASEHIALCTVSNVKHALDRMKDEGISIIGAENGPYPPPWGIDLGGPAAIVIGSEGQGLRRTVKERCDTLVSLPLRGRVDSLNASVAAGIVIYEYLRQNPGLLAPPIPEPGR